MKAGFIGVGAMGLPMSQRLVDQGHELVVFDLRHEAMQPLLDRGAVAANSPKDVADKAEIVFVSVPSNDAYRSVTCGPDGVIEGAAVRICISLCTTGSRFAREMTETLAAEDIVTVESPISGGPPGAREGTLSIMVSGPKPAFEEVEPLLRCFSGNVFYIGDKPAMAQTLKLANNLLSAAALVTTAEVLVMGAKAGIDPEIMLQAINKGSGRNSATESKFPLAVLPRSFDFGARIDILGKDVILGLEEAEAFGVPMWVNNSVRQFFIFALAQGDGPKDITTLVQHIERWADTEIPKTR